MAEGVYPNGLPHPPASLRARMALELGVLAFLTATFLYCVEKYKLRSTVLYVGMALIGFAMIGLNRRETAERIWGPPDYPAFDRVRRCAVYMSFLTIPAAIIFLIMGIAGRYWNPYGMYTDAKPMFSLHFLITMALYLPWALLQQTLFQFYLLGRFRALLPFASPLFLAIVNGTLYGLLHVSPKWDDAVLTLVTIIGGIFWSYSYYRDRYVIPIAISHAVLATTFFYWVYGRDLVEEMIVKFGH